MDLRTWVEELTTEYAADLIGLPGRAPLLSWRVAGEGPASSQLAYEIQASAVDDFEDVLDARQGEGPASQFIEAPGGRLPSRAVRCYRVRIRTESGWTSWSSAVRLEAGLLSAIDYVGRAIGDATASGAPVALLRKQFAVDSRVLRARLYITANGLFEAHLNGTRIGHEELAPGWTPYGQRLLVVTHDVTTLLRAGSNAIGVELADGWFRGKFGFLNRVDNYGTHTALLLQLEITYEDGSRSTIASDRSWRTAQGEIRFASIYDGCTVDLGSARPGWTTAEFDDSEWLPALERELDFATLEPRGAEPVRVIAELPTAITRSLHTTRIVVGQNISGWLRLRVRTHGTASLVVRHAEVLEPDGTLHTKALRAAKATDHFEIPAAGEYTLEPRFTFHGFQYADIVAQGDIEILDVLACAISSDLPTRSTFVSSHTTLNQLVRNTYWSLRDNFVSIPTDCPQRDERLGWTGDAQAFAYAAHTLVIGYQFYKSWLRDVALEQSLQGGRVPMVVPDLISIQMNGENPFGTDWGEAGWADAATILPWSMYERFGDIAILRDQLESMRAWVACNAGDHEGLLIPERMQLGDWLDPDAPEAEPWRAKVSGRFMANAFMARSVDLLARTERLLGNHAEAEVLEVRLAQLRDAIWIELGSAAAVTETGAAVLLQFDLAPSVYRARIADGLARRVRDAEGRIATGFLGTPLVLDALSSNGYLDEAFLMLLRVKPRSWLYPITVGATTIWERWEAIAEDGTISGGALSNPAEDSEASMISFNHYAYGAVVDWVHRVVGGIAPSAPGYQEVRIAPRPHIEVTSCATTVKTGYGDVTLQWQVTGNELTGRLELPFGVHATLDLDATGSTWVNGVEHLPTAVLMHGVHHFQAVSPSVAGASTHAAAR